jgi:crotonobetainyl-CoA:carnitine CoA-transferase CaiB-like acyl-CoA transferase
VNRIDEVFADPQVRHREMQISMAHPTAGDGEVSLIGNPIKLSETPVGYRRAPPTLGQHTDEVLREVLGMDGQEVERYRKNSVI